MTPQSGSDDLFGLDRVLLAQVAESNPGMVSTLTALLGHLEGGPLPEPAVLHAYGQMLCRLGALVIGRADQLAQPKPPPVIDA